MITLEPPATIPLPFSVTLTQLFSTTESSMAVIPAPVDITLAPMTRLFETIELYEATIPYSPPDSTPGLL